MLNVIKCSGIKLLISGPSDQRWFTTQLYNEESSHGTLETQCCFQTQLSLKQDENELTVLM